VGWWELWAGGRKNGPREGGGKKRKRRETEIGRGEFEDGFRTFKLLNLFALKTTTHIQTKQMQRHECIKHLVNSKFNIV
jgi:hypothetical protein